MDARICSSLLTPLSRSSGETVQWKKLNAEKAPLEPHGKYLHLNREASMVFQIRVERPSCFGHGKGLEHIVNNKHTAKTPHQSQSKTITAVYMGS